MTNTPTQAAIEAAARAIENGSAEEWEALPVIHKQVFRAHAKNAIEAYRAAMREAGFVEVERKRLYDLKDAPRKDWNDEVAAVIAATKEGE